MKTLLTFLNTHGSILALLALGGAPVANLIVFICSGLVWGIRSIPVYWSVVSTLNRVFHSVYMYLFS